MSMTAPKGRPFATRDGIWVRSHGEQRIADFLSRRNVAYSYEPALAGYRPDFLLRDHAVIIEYFGGAGWRKYAEKAAKKIDAYEAAGFAVIALVPLNLRDIERELDERFRELGVWGAEGMRQDSVGTPRHT